MIILLSGGPNSVSLAYWAKERGFILDHGYKHSSYELQYAQEIANLLDVS